MNFRILQIIFLASLFSLTAMKEIVQDHCDADDDDAAIGQWFGQVYDVLHKNQNLSLQVNALNEKLESKTQEINRKLDLCLTELQQNERVQNNKESSLLQKINHLEQQLQEIHQRNNGNIVIQRRQDGSVDFYRNWNEYKQGFGNTSGEFFIGLDKLHKLTNSRPYGLLIVLEDWENDRRYAKYDAFIVGSETENYILKSVGRYSGSAGDSLSTQLNQKFSTKDRDNDSSGSEHCAVKYNGAWWYAGCHESNLNGRYLKGTHTEYAVSVIWYKFKGHHYSLKYAEMTLIPQ